MNAVQQVIKRLIKDKYLYDDIHAWRETLKLALQISLKTYSNKQATHCKQTINPVEQDFLNLMKTLWKTQQVKYFIIKE